MPRALIAASLLVLTAVGCQNWDMLEPESRDPSGARSFTRIGDDPDRLTNEVAIRRVREIEETAGLERVELIDAFLVDFAEARFIPEVHALAGEAYLGADQPVEASTAFARALALTRTDVLGLPLEPELPLQLGMAKLSAGETEEGLRWLARASLGDHSPQMQQSLRWAHAQQSTEPFEDWLAALRDEFQVEAPGFSLPGLATATVDFERDRGRATLINFWSPT